MHLKKIVKKIQKNQMIKNLYIKVRKIIKTTNKDIQQHLHQQNFQNIQMKLIHLKKVQY